MCLLEGRTTLEGAPSKFTPQQIEAAYFGFVGVDDAGADA
jgi:hypothetical protein